MFLSISISFLYFLTRSARNKGNKSVSGKFVDLEDVRLFMDFRVLESALRS